MTFSRYTFYFLLAAVTPQALGAPTISFLDEYVISANLTFQNSSVGGLSSIEYVDGKYYFVVDDNGQLGDKVIGKPRFYEAGITIRQNKIESVEFERTMLFENYVLDGLDQVTEQAKQFPLDPESLRILPTTGQVIWTSEGGIKHKIAPAIFVESKGNNAFYNSMQLPEMFKLNDDSGPRHNAVFEGLSISHDHKGIWVSMEGALKQDDTEADLEKGALLRFSHFDLKNQTLTKQFVYPLSKMPRRPNAKPDAFRTNGVVEILQINATQFLVLERAYTSGLADGGNNVDLFFVDISKATDVKAFFSLKEKTFSVAAKKKLLSLNDIVEQLPSKRIDNLEGMTLGPELANGKQSLLMISDNNFNLYGSQLSQVLLFELNL